MRHQAVCCSPVASAALLIAALVATSSADIPQMISYQGRVTDDTGIPVADGTYDMRFRIYDDETAGSLEWDSGTRSVDVEGGVFNVYLGESPQPTLSLPFNEDYWLLVTFDGVNQTPRHRFASAGYAYMASGLVPGTVVEGAVSGGGAIEGDNNAATGNVYGGVFDVGPTHSGGYGAGILGRNTSSAGYDNYGGLLMSWGLTGTGVKGWAVATTGQNYGVYGQSDSDAGLGVYGEASAITNTLTYGGKFECNSGYGRAVYGRASHTSGTTYGGKFHSASASGTGVCGWAEAISGTNYGVYGLTYSPQGVGVYGEGPDLGVKGYASAPTGTNYGGYFESASSSGRGVYAEAPEVGVRGYASATTGYAYGGWFESPSNQASGVRAYATSTTGVTYGVYGRSSSATDGSRGIYGRCDATTGTTYGVYGQSDSDQGRGVYGGATSPTGFTTGGFFESGSPDGRGVEGYVTATTGYSYGGRFESDSPNGTGVRGKGDRAGGVFVDGDNGNWVWVSNGTYKINGNGTVNFVQNHPYRDDRVIAYSAPEGDEVATYTRGTARMENGEARVALGETFKWVTNPDIGLTAHLTPRGDCNGLYIASLTTTEMMVRELMSGTSDVTFDYVVYGLRIGFAEVSIVQEKQEESYIPSMEDHRELYAKHPDLRQYNALERFKAMRTSSGNGEPLDLSASEALRNAVEEYDPRIHGAVESQLDRARTVRQAAGTPASPMPRSRHRSHEEEVVREQELRQTRNGRTEIAGLPDQGKREAWNRVLRGATNLDGGGENR